MGKNTAILSGFMLLLGIFGCGPNPESPAAAILSGEHELRKLVEFVGQDSKVSAGFFLVVGDVSMESRTTTSVKFSWKLQDGTYAIGSLPIEKIRIKLDDSKKVPTIKFRWAPYYSNRIDKLMREAVVYAVITAKEEDWPIKIQMPLN